MNNTRRKEIKKVIDVLESLNMTINELQTEEGDAMDAIAEKFGGTERYEHMEECYDALRDAIDSLSDVISYLEQCL